MKKEFIISQSPHIHSGDSIPKNMYGILIALLPAFLTAVYFFGVGALVVTAVSVTACVLCEYLIQKFLLKQEKTTAGDGSAILTGVLLAFSLPSNLPFWIIIIGAIVAIGVAKMSFGGLGNNPFNPALVGRVFLLISFPVQMTLWPRPMAWSTAYMDAETAATPLSILKGHSVRLPDITDMLFGNMGGSLGEASAIALATGFAFLLIRKIITWHIPVSILLTVFVFTDILHLINPEVFVSPQIHLFTGGLLLGAIFMATDCVTSPMTVSGMWVYGIGIGIITVLIRVFGAYPEGVSFAILIMNAFTPLINKYIKPKRYGGVALKVKLGPFFFNMLWTLTGISLCAALALGLVHAVTEEPIETSKTAEQQRAVKEVLPTHERLDKPDTIEVPAIGTVEIYKAYDGDNRFVGAAVKSSSGNGFGGEIKIMVGFDSKGIITNYAVLEQKETPGLGTKIVDRFKPAAQVKKSLLERIFGFEEQAGERNSSIIGKNPATDNLLVTQDGGAVDGITAATISSRAFLEAVRSAYDAYANNPDAPDTASGATVRAGDEDKNK